MIVAAFISDRGDKYLPACIESFCQNVPRVASTRVIDDRAHGLGMAGAVQTAWTWALEEGADYLLHIEEDFVFSGPVPLKGMELILEQNTHLAQCVLKRQPWSSEEVSAGGIIELHPDAYTECGRFVHWVEHERIFSLNPCLIPRRVLELGWPDGPLGIGNETGFTNRCLAAGYRFAFYGRKTDPPRVTHVGASRAAGWRL